MNLIDLSINRLLSLFEDKLPEIDNQEMLKLLESKI